MPADILAPRVTMPIAGILLKKIGIDCVDQKWCNNRAHIYVTTIQFDKYIGNNIVRTVLRIFAFNPKYIYLSI